MLYNSTYIDVPSIVKELREFKKDSGAKGYRIIADNTHTTYAVLSKGMRNDLGSIIVPNGYRIFKNGFDEVTIEIL